MKVQKNIMSIHSNSPGSKKKSGNLDRNHWCEANSVSVEPCGFIREVALQTGGRINFKLCWCKHRVAVPWRTNGG